MADTTILQYDIVSKILLPFLLVFFIVFAILERTKLLGDKKQINALTAFVIGLIFVGAVYPVLVVSNLILFLTVTIVAVFVILLLWGFVFVDNKDNKLEKGLKLGLGIVVTIAFIWAVLWATGWINNLGTIFSGGMGQTIITNAVFLLVIGVAIALVLINPKGK
ncbi:hypothetical protein M0R19_00135 [Candidatus Pacearchaeota archaeon]|jgi:hypothetical protein|nr:hypothetical protein [Candidatus Pacearchaeota archaeon]